MAEEVAAVVDAMNTTRHRIADARFVVPPTIVQELALAARSGETERMQASARQALSQLRAWRFEPLRLTPVAHGIVERIAAEIRHSDLLPSEEFNDSLILAESGFMECQILVRDDAHWRSADFQRHTLLLRSFHVAAPVIATPREIVRKFFR